MKEELGLTSLRAQDARCDSLALSLPLPQGATLTLGARRINHGLPLLYTLEQVIVFTVRT